MKNFHNLIEDVYYKEEDEPKTLLGAIGLLVFFVVAFFAIVFLASFI